MTKHYTDEGTLLIRNSDIKDGKFEFGDNPIYLEKTFAEKNETRMHQIGDVITVHTGDVGTSAVITENEAKSIGFATIVTRPNPKIIDSNYLCSFLNTDKHKKWAVSISTGDGRTNYNLGDYFELVVPVPSIAEQKKIASYIQKLNRLITLHQREFAFLCKEKSKKFRYIKNAWEQRKLGDIASDMVAGGDIDKDLILAEGQYPVIANALTGDGIVGYYDKEYRVNAPAVTVTGRGDVGHAKARLVNFTPVVRLLSVKSEHDVFFLENAINTLKIVIESTGVPQLTVPQLAKYEVAFPRQLDEEEHIGVFFKQLDHLITLHQRELEKLQNIKKSMLEKMFV